MFRFAPLALVGVLLFAGCSAATVPRETPAATSSSEAVVAPAPAAPAVTEAPIAYPIDRTADLQAAAGPYLTSAAEIAEGSIEVRTNIPDPRVTGDAATSAAAIALCEQIVAHGATQVSIYEAGGSVFVVYGDPTHGEVCTQI